MIDQLKKIEEQMKAYELSHACEFVHFYKWQKEAIKGIHQYQICVIPAPNKIGKCLTESTYVSTLDGEKTILELHKEAKPFKVWAWDGKKKVVAQALAPFKKEGQHKCYRITMSDGQWIEAADHHKILTDIGWLSTKDLHVAYSQNLSPYKKLKVITPQPNNIISIEYVGVEEVYDFTVEKYHNYIAGGLVNHNTCLLVNVALSWALGYEPWTFSETEFPGSIYVRHKKGYYNPSSLGKPPPVKIRITGEDWRKHLGEVIVPELKKWAPAGEYETTKNDFSIEDKWNFKNGSTFELMTYSQKLDLFESWTGDGWIPDEPPMKEVYDAMGRGIFLNNGKIVMMMTPIKEPWIWDEFVEPENPRTDVFLMKDLSVLNNEQAYKEDDELLAKAGLTELDRMEYFKMIIEFEGLSKTQHIRKIEDFLRARLAA